MNANLKTGKGGQETELNGKSSLRRRRIPLDCSAVMRKEKQKKKMKKKKYYK
jgi:hypothetical protein